MKTVSNLEGLRSLVGQDLGESSWREVTQDEVNAFADMTGDHQWIHIDQARAKAGPYGGTVAHGFLTLALIAGLIREVLSVKGTSLAVNYGLNRVRFPAPLLVGSRVQLRARLLSLEEIPNGVQTVLEATILAEGQAKPCCVAEPVFRYYFS